MRRSLGREASPILSRYPAVWLPAPPCPTALWVRDTRSHPWTVDSVVQTGTIPLHQNGGRLLCPHRPQNGPGIGFQGLGADGCRGIGPVMSAALTTVRHLSADKPLDRNGVISGSDNADGADGRAPTFSGAAVRRIVWVRARPSRPSVPT